MFTTLRHLLPDSLAWRLVADRLLRKYLKGVSSVGSDARDFIDDVYEDLIPSTTRELANWETQFDLYGSGDDATRRAALEAAWAAQGGQGPDYLESIIQAAGWPTAKVYESFDPAFVSLSKDAAISFTGPFFDTDPGNICFGAGGRYLYVVGKTSERALRWELSVPYDISTATALDPINQYEMTEEADPVDIQLSADGTRMFILGDANNGVWEYVLSQPWDLTSATYNSQFFSVTTQELSPTAFFWKPDGTRFYLVGTNSDDVHQYNLSTAWTLSSASWESTHSPVAGNTIGVAIADNGQRLLIMYDDGDIEQYDFTTPWELAGGMTYVNSPLTTIATDIDSAPTGIHVSDNLLFVTGSTVDGIYTMTYGGPRDPLDYANQPLVGRTQCGDDGTEVSGETPIAECGEQPPGQTSILSAVCDDFLANEVFYLWNETLTERAPPPIPATPSSGWDAFWYVGEAPIGTKLDVFEEDRERFEKVLLRIGPADKWIVTIINVLTRPSKIGEWRYESTFWTSGAPLSGELQFNVTSTTLVIHDVDNDSNDAGAGGFSV